jgi:hypothetical protein
LLFAILTSLSTLPHVQAQVRAGWSEPFQLSTPDREAAEASLVADEYGFVHVFWPETLPDEKQLLRYARFDGATWSLPIDIRVTDPFVPIKMISAAVGPGGIVHLAWVEGNNGPAFYSQAPVSGTLASQNWRTPVRIQIPSVEAKLEVDSEGVLHLLFSVSGNGPIHAGVYYMQSSDEGGFTSRLMALKAIGFAMLIH